MGKFHGVISPTTPTGLRSANMCTRSRSLGTSMPGSREPFAREVAENVDGAPHLALGLGQRLALLARHISRDRFEVLVQMSAAL